MLFAALTTAVLLAASAHATLWCKDSITQGTLRIVKNNLTSTESYPLGFGPKQTSAGFAYLVVNASQPIFGFTPCDSAFVGSPGEYGDGSLLTAVGKITFAGKCLTRNKDDGGLVLGTCAKFDGSDQSDQFFEVKLPYYPPAGDVVGTNRAVSFLKKGTYHQMQSQTIYEPTTKPASTWFLSWSYTE